MGTEESLVSYIVIALTCLALPLSQAENWITAEGFTEYCETEIFRAKCDEGHVILMENARYGRMRIGRCLDRDYGYVGCSKDVLGIADRWCSGRQSCEVPIPNSAMRSTNPCPRDLKPYFEAGYRCLKVEDGNDQNCEKAGIVKVTSTEGFLSKMIAMEKGYGTADCPWFLEAKPGQKLNITLLDFSLSAWEQTNLASNDGVCRVTAIIREKGETSGVTVCGGEGREKNVYTSLSNALEIRILGVSDSNKGYFLLRFDTVGCPDPEPPQHGRVKRRGDTAEVMCDNNNRKWKLTCRGHDWIGDQWNCSTDVAESKGTKIGDAMLGSLLMPFEVSIVIIVAIALAIGIIILSIGLVCLRWRLKARARSKRDNKGAIPAQNNAYDEKMAPRTDPTVSQESFPPPPYPESENGELINMTENEYAYIAEMPPPPMSTPGVISNPNPQVTPSQANGAGPTARHTSQSSASESPRPNGGLKHHSRHGSSSFGSPQLNGPSNRRISDPRAPTEEWGKVRYQLPTYEKAVANGPVYPSKPSGYNHNPQITPKLLAHECALAVRGTNESPYAQGQGSKSKAKSPRTTRSRLHSELGDTPTYFELDPEAAPYNFAPVFTDKATGTLPGSNSPRTYRANNGTTTFRSEGYNSNGKHTL